MKLITFARELLACMASLLASMTMSSVMGFSSILLPQLQLRHEVISVETESDKAWIASMAALPLFAGTLINAVVVEKFGRKNAMLLSQIPTPGWFLIFLSPMVPNAMTILLIGRFLTGISAGMISGIPALYITEISSTEHRSVMLALLNLSVSLGILLTHVLGIFIEWETIALLVFIVSIVIVILMFLSPETPIWLITHKRRDKASKNFIWLRNIDEETIAENTEFKSLIDRSNRDDGVRKNVMHFMKGMIKSSFYKPLLISIGFFVTAQLAGVSAVTFYTMQIFSDLLEPEVEPEIAMVIIDTVRLFVSLVTIFLMHYCKRRVLALSSCIGVTISLFSMSLYQYFDFNLHYAYPLTIVLSYIVFINVGLLPLPWCMLGELFSSDMKGLGASISASAHFLTAYCVVTTVPISFRELKSEGTFCLYGVFALIGTIFLFFFLPETKDVPLHELERIFDRKRKDEDETS